jgi:signal transduction histidine kinase
VNSEVLRTVVRGTVAVTIAVLVLLGDGGTSAITLVVLGVALLYVATSTVAARRVTTASGREAADVARAFGDVVALCAVIVAVDHPPADLLLFLCAVPLGHSLTLPANVIAAVTAASVVGALAIWATGVAVHPEPVTNSDLLITSFGLVWAGLVSCLIALERERRATRITELSGTLQDLIAQVITAEETERARVADLLHDDVLQLLLVTRHDVTDALDGDTDALPRAADGIDLATRHLRRTVGGLRSEGVSARRLGDGLDQLAAQTAERRGCEVAVEVAAELRDGEHPVILSLGRDLLREIERRSTATTIEIRAFTRNRDVVLAVRHDDPRYMGLRASDGPSDLLTAVDQRARAVGGSFVVSRTPDGTRLFTVLAPLVPSPAPNPDTARQRSHATAALPWRRATDPTPTMETRHDVQAR